MLSTLINFIKTNQRAILMGILLLLAITISFGLGYLTRGEFNPAPIIIEKCSQN